MSERQEIIIVGGTRVRAPIGAGTALKRAIHAIVDASPLPGKTKEAIKNCSKCDARSKVLDSTIPNINPFAK